MSLTYSFRTAKDVIDKLRRDVDVLNEEVTGDCFFNLVITAYHLTDWIKNDTSIPLAAKNDINSMYLNQHVAVCRDIANASKHFSLSRDYKNQVTDLAHASQGYGCGRFNKGLYGVGEESIDIECSDGTKLSSIELAKEVLAAWEVFFSKHGI